ncbi:T9SS type A sorting domain-containing protein [Plebeiibacterium sediminum]|uniref:T9SS type A sorting domain-containing protein n=1 Tax=Plebeiibacterium sediminum TaxID=2992112 RepID=A0AAE3M326_9BACT|nr:T9SS type A sorting domain-containing protein [Plebeiobacterium sediminum]MCW3785919.1 T9SS type A sorting domain-containing protein [Plebeiobacterium sediminum]
MKYFYLGLFLFFVTSLTNVVKGQVTTFWTDDFEIDNGWAVTGEFEIGAPVGGAGDHGYANPTSAYSGSRVLGTNLDGGYSNNLADRAYIAVSPVIDCSGKQNVTLVFQRWLNVERNNYDHAYIDVFDGSVWHNVWANNNTTIAENAWSYQSVDISNYADNNANVQIRFALGETDPGWTYSGWNIDNVELTSSPNPVNGDYRSRTSNNWDAYYSWYQYNGYNWNTNGNDPGENGNAGTVTIRNGHTITVNYDRPIGGNSIQNLVVESGGTLRYNWNLRSLTLNGSVTGGGTVDMTRNTLAHNLTVGGDFLPGSFSAGNANLYLNGSSTQNIGGFTYNNLTVSGGGDKVLTGNTIINGSLTLNGARIILGDYDLIIADGASIAGTYSSSNMIVTNGTGRLIKEGNENSDYQMIYPVGTGAYYTPYQISSIACSDATGAVEVRAVSGAAPGPPTAEVTDLQKYWEVNGDGLTVNTADISFTYDNAEVGIGGNQNSYALQVYTGGVWMEPSGASATGFNPMVASGINNISGTWTALEQEPQKIYYAYRSGNWNDISTWTHDPGGTTQTAIDIPGDDSRVVILNGRTVTLTSDVSITGMSMAILSGGFVNMGNYQFTNTIKELSGQGTLKLASGNFPVVTTNYLVTADGGTVEFNNSSNFVLPTAQTEYNHLVINGSAIAIQKNDLTLHGNLHVKQGTYRINDGSTARYQLTIDGDVTVESGASLTVGTGNTTSGGTDNGGVAPFTNYYATYSHTVVINGDFTNNGTVRFTNQSYPEYGAFATNGAATVYFRGASDNILTCNNQTDFYNLVLDKGIDQTFKLTVYSSAYSNFRLFGRNTYGGEGGGANPNLRKALWIRTGTLVLQGLTVIPSLTEGGSGGNPNSDYYIPVNGALVLDGTDVAVLTTADDYAEVNAAYSVNGGTGSVNGVNRSPSLAQSFSVYGKVQIKNGYLSTRESGGIIIWNKASAEVVVDGGILDIKQFRSGGTEDGLASYIQNGGQTIFRGRFQRESASVASVSDIVHSPLITTHSFVGITNAKGSLCIDNPDNIFSMSGGTIEVLDVCGTNNYAIDIFSAVKNINVSGGTIKMAPQTGSNDMIVRSSAPFGNLIVENASGSTSKVRLESSTPEVSGNLEVLGNVDLVSGTLNASGYELKIGRDFTIDDGATYTTGANRTVFNGNVQQNLVVNLSAALNLNKLVIGNSASKLQLKGTQSNVNVADSLIIANGELDDNGKTINVSGNIYNAGIHSGAGQIIMSGSSIKGNGEFNNLYLNGTGNITVGDDIVINGLLTFGQDHLLNIGTHNLKFTSGASILGQAANRYIQTAGNVGDGGVTFSYDNLSTKTWPIGVSNYTPATIGFSSAPTSFGDITIVPVNFKHPVTKTTGGGEALSYYWRVKSNNFSGFEGKVTHSFVYADANVGSDNENNYLPARYDASAFGWDIGDKTNIDRNTNTINDWTTSINNIDGDYTCGSNPAFVTPEKYYSISSGLWNDKNNWSTEGHTGKKAAKAPGAGDIVIIGNGHTITMDRYDNTANRDPHYCASLQIETGGVLDVTYNPGSDFGMVVSHPNGNGKIRISVNDYSGSVFEFPGGDFSDFNANLGTTELYTNNATSGRTYWLPDGVEEYGNLMITPLGGSNIIFPNNDISILGDLTADGQSSQSWYCPTWNSNYPGSFNNSIPQAKAIAIKGDFNLIGGALIYYGNRDLAQDIIVEGDLIVSENAGIGVNSYAYNQSITIGGSLINNSRVPGGAPNGDRGCDFEDIPLIFKGDDNAKITQSSGVTYTTYTKIETIKVNKGSSQATTLTMDITGTVDYASNEWLTLVNGTFIYNRNRDVNVSTNNSFTIPVTAGLTINTANSFNLCGGDSNDYDVYLNGKLTVINGSLNIGNASNNRNNDIEYSGSGLSEIDIQGGSLFVNGQVRRNPASSAGILKYNQSGGDVTVNGRNLLATNAKLEVLNAGSEFNMSNGTLTIVRGGGTTYGDLYLRPEKSSVTGGEIIFDNSGVATQNYLLDANVPLNNLTIRGNGNNAIVKLLLSPLTLNGDLTLSNTNSILDSNPDFNVAVTINGDFNNSGVYNYYLNTTAFSGGTQQITGNSDVSFYNLIVNPLTNLTLNKDVIVNNNLTLSSGTLVAGPNTINVKGNVNNDANYTSTGDGLLLNGGAVQVLSGTGTFARVELDNAYGAELANDITINGDLVLTRGVLNIKNHLLTLEESASLSGSFSVGNMIITNGVYSNKGVKKVISSGDTPAFTFPIGVNGKYTPVVLDLSSSDNTASVQIHPVNYKHPANIDGANVLDYFWAVESQGLSNAIGTLSFTYLEEDIQGNESEYYAARLLVPGTSWTKNNAVDEENNLISFTVSGDNISGEYTAGKDTAFPDNVPEYTSVSNGDWSDKDIWTQTGGDAYSLSGAPDGFIVVINHEVSLDGNYAQAYRTTISAGAKLKIDDLTYGHNLGMVSGSGTLYLEQGNLPEGNYDAFLGCSNNSTLEFGGSRDYNILSDLFNNAANLLFSGTGTRTLPDADLSICKQLVIDGPVLDNSLYNRTIYVNGSFIRQSGTFNSGSGDNATVSFTGDTEQFIGGFTGVNNALNNLEINNSAGLTLNDDIEVKGKLLLTNGLINTSATETLTITNTSMNCVTPASGKANSYVNGPLTKRMNQSDSFIFPIGIDGELGSSLKLTAVQTGTKLWTAEYKRPNDTYTNFSFPLTAINSHEYWNISTPGGGQANIQLGWNAGSDITPAMTEHGLTDIRVVSYDGANWQEINSNASGTDSNGQVITVNRVSVTAAGSDFTTATVNTNKPKVRFNPDGAICDLSTGIKVELSSTVPTAADYELSYSINGIEQTDVTVNGFPYYLSTPTVGVYKITGFKYDNKVRTGVFDVTTVEVFPSPTTADAGEDQTLQGLTQTTLAANTATVGTGVWSIVSGTGGSFVDPTNPVTTFNGTAGSSYVLSWTITNGDCQSVDQVNVAFPLIPPHVWLGTTNNWFDPNNWSDGIIPSETVDVTLAPVVAPKVDAVISNTAEAKVNNLTIESGASLTLSEGARFTVSGNLITNNNVVIENSVLHPTSVITLGSVTGEVTYKWKDFTLVNWWQIALPVNGVTQSEFETSFGSGRYAVNRYVGKAVTSNGWERVAGFANVYSDSYNFDQVNQELEGYSLYTANAGVLTYSGVLNNSIDYTMVNMDARWHLVANPYPCYINVENAGFDMGDFLKTIYIRKGDNQVSTYNLLNGQGLLEGSRYIAPGQSMWLRTYKATNDDVISISNSARTHLNGGYGLKSSSNSSDDVLKLKLKSDYNEDETIIVFNNNGSRFVTEYDSEKLMNGGKNVNIYSLKEEKNIAINSYTDLSYTDNIPLGYTVSSAGSGEFTLRASNINSFMPDVNVYLIDKGDASNIITVNLRENPSYTFTPTNAASNDRFELRFVPSVTTDINDVPSAANRDVNIYAVKQVATVKVTEEVLQSTDRIINVYDISGQLVKTVELNNEETTFNLPQANTVYIISVKANGETYQQKVVSQN